MWKVLTKENISYVVAPYETDAQLTFLVVSKQVNVEDSNLISFGCLRVSYPIAASCYIHDNAQPLSKL